MDNNTILMLYGDHGMTVEGNHGGDSENEIRTVFFAYSKSGFPMLQQSKEVIAQLQQYSFDDLKL